MARTTGMKRQAANKTSATTSKRTRDARVEESDVDSEDQNDADNDADIPGRKSCPVCNSQPSGLQNSPTSCGSLHTSAERACVECWEAYVSIQVEERRAEEIECMFCFAAMPEGEIKRLSRKATAERYDVKVIDRVGQRYQARCTASRVLKPCGNPDHDDNRSFKFELQAHEPEKDGRIFASKYCAFETCTTCDRPEPEDVGETDSAYQTRLHLLDPPLVVKHKVDNKDCGVCPDRHSYFTVDQVCGYAACTACQYRFCMRCLIPWMGEGSYYLGGKLAHGTEANEKACKYYKRVNPSAHALKYRFGMTKEEQAEAAIAEKAKAMKKEAAAVKKRQKGAAVAENGDEDGGVAKKVKHKGMKGKGKSTALKMVKILSGMGSAKGRRVATKGLACW